MSVQNVVGSPPSSLSPVQRPLKSNEEMGRNGSRFDVELRLTPESTPPRPASALRSVGAAAGPRPPHPTHRISVLLRSKGTASAGTAPRPHFVNQTPNSLLTPDSFPPGGAPGVSGEVRGPDRS